MSHHSRVRCASRTYKCATVKSSSLQVDVGNGKKRMGMEKARSEMIVKDLKEERIIVTISVVYTIFGHMNNIRCS